MKDGWLITLLLVILIALVVSCLPFIREAIKAIFQKKNGDENQKKNIQVIHLEYKDEKERRNLEWAHEFGLPQIFGRLNDIQRGERRPCWRGTSPSWLDRVLDGSQIKKHDQWIKEMEKKPAWQLLSEEEKYILRESYWYVGT